MSEPKTIDVEATTEPQANQQTAVARYEGGGAVGRAMTISELHERLEFVRRVMKQEMKEGQDYGKIPGVDKPCLLQPGAQKLLMTFGLREQVKKEVLRDFPSMAVAGHREYEFTMTVFPAGGSPDNGWDGVGTCTTLEGKYRYRKAERRCPACGKDKIIAGKAEYGGGWLCWKKKGGCGEKFAENDPRIASQDAETTEHENPADYWNTCRKMAFKRGLVHAAINATNTSELWSQDVEDMADNASATPKATATPRQRPQEVATRAAATSAASAPKPPAQGQPQAKIVPPAKTWEPSPKARAWTIRKLDAVGLKSLALEFWQKVTDPAGLMETETLEDLPLSLVPVSYEQLNLLIAAITDFGNGDEAKHPYRPNPVPGEQPKRTAKPQVRQAPPPADPQRVPPPEVQKAQKDPEWWRDIIVPVPHKGQKRDEYMRNPDTLGSLYDQCKTGGEQECKRLWGFVNHFEAKPWQGRDGQMRPATQTDLTFRQALDAFADWDKANGHKDQGAPSHEDPSAAPGQNEEEQRTPFD